VAEMAILQLVDKCVRCNGCVISCKRTWHMLADLTASPDLPHQTLAKNQRVVIKSQKRVDMGPFMRFSCWHCKDAPCIGRCPYQAITKSAEGAVWIDPNLCQADLTGGLCRQQCKTDCQRGGIPMIGVGSELFTTPKAWKCTLCTGTYENAPYNGAGEGTAEFPGDLPSKAPGVDGSRHSVLPGRVDLDHIAALDHQPSCVFTCPANAMVYDTRANIMAYLQRSAEGWVSIHAGGSMFWASKKTLIAPPKADPFMEDHVSPMVGGLLSSPFAKAALAPTLVVGGLLALSARRAKMEQEASMTGEEL
jgi:Fe-S-cluster-containing dehydrogenase component